MEVFAFLSFFALFIFMEIPAKSIIKTTKFIIKISSRSPFVIMMLLFMAFLLVVFTSFFTFIKMALLPFLFTIKERKKTFIRDLWKKIIKKRIQISLHEFGTLKKIQIQYQFFISSTSIWFLIWYFTLTHFEFEHTCVCRSLELIHYS